MNVTVNGKQTDVAAKTITELLSELKVKSPDQVAVEWNGEILEREVYASTTVKDGDVIEFLYFMGGGRGPLG